MIEAHSVSAVRAAEESAMARLPEGELMQRAARGLAEVLAARVAQRGAGRVVVLAGPGDNGGDALYAAARLTGSGRRAAEPAARDQDDLDVVVVAATEGLHPGGAETARQAGIRIVGAGDPAPSAGVLDLVTSADLVVDGLLGIGGRAGLRGPMAALADAIGVGAYVVAVDLPSGADPQGEQASAAAVFADETVTFGVPKPVHLLPATEPSVGRLTVVDIGLEIAEPPVVQRLTHDDVAALWPVPGPFDDKYSRGVLGLVAGSEQYTGAAVMAATAAVSAGAGMVRYVGAPAPTALVRAGVPEVVIGPGRVQAWALGSGMDVQAPEQSSEQAPEQARAALDSDVPCLLDAGALDLLDGPREAPTLLTPHAGELARLLSRLEGREVARRDVSADPLTHARRAADRTGATVLLKGSTTLVVPPTRTGLAVRSQADAPAWLATAGTGDVLAGLAGTLLAAGLTPLDAGSLAALVHGRAAEASNPGGPVRALAVAHAIPEAVARLLGRG